MASAKLGASAKLVASARLVESFGKTPMSFEANEGQADSRFKYIARGAGYGVFLAPDQAVFALPRRSDRRKSVTGALAQDRARSVKPPALLKMNIVGANPGAVVTGRDTLSSSSNYFIGNNPERWRSNIRHYGKVQCDAIYPGIDLIYYGNQRQLEYDFIVSPGSDPSRIELGFEGAAQVRVAGNGELAIRTASGELLQRKPVVYQMAADGKRQELEGRYVVRGARRIGFEVEKYDRSRPLVIDPALVYSTYLGGSDLDIGNAIKAGVNGESYVAGVTYSPDFPTKFPLQLTLQGVGHAFVSKFNAAGGLVYSTYLGGAGEDVGFAVTIDSTGAVYVGGSTSSKNFPTTSGAAQSTSRGKVEGFITKLNPTGSAIVYSTYLGGQADDVINGIAIDSSKQVYVTGETLSLDYPVRGGLQGLLKGGADAFVTKLNAAGSDFVYSTLLGGAGLETGYGIEVDGAGSAYVTGFVYSSDFPTKNSLQPSLGGRVDAFVTKLNPAGNGLVYSTYYGGADDDGGFSIGIDASLNAYITGFTASTDFGVKGASQPTSAGGDEAFVAKFDQDGALVWSTYLGGGGGEQAYGIAVDNAGNSYITGRTDSPNFPVKSAIQTKIGGSSLTGGAASAKAQGPAARRLYSGSPVTAEGGIWDQYRRDSDRFRTVAGEPKGANAQTITTVTAPDGFIAKFSPSGALIFSSYLGGADEDRGFSISVDNQGYAYVTGMTASGDFSTKTPVQQSLRGIADGFILRFQDDGVSAQTQTSVSAANYTPGITRDQIVAAFGAGLADTTKLADTLPLPTQLGGVSVKVTDSLGAQRMVPLFFVSPTQINYLMPTDVASGPAKVSVVRNDVEVTTESLPIVDLAPGVFSADTTGSGPAAAVALRVKPGNSQIYESVIQYNQALSKYELIPLQLGAGDQLYLVFFGTGFRNHGPLSSVTATLGGVSAPVFFAGPQGSFAGLDQVTVLAPAELAGRGDVDFVLTADGKTANPVKVSFK
jgi:uncharacterized protein (TIGR03437 family)